MADSLDVVASLITPRAKQDLPVPGKRQVTRTLIYWLLEREAAGIATYAKTLETEDGRDNDRDAMEEAVDLIQYLFKGKIQAEDRVKLLADALSGMLDDCHAGYRPTALTVQHAEAAMAVIEGSL